MRGPDPVAGAAHEERSPDGRLFVRRHEGGTELLLAPDRRLFDLRGTGLQAAIHWREEGGAFVEIERPGDRRQLRMIVDADKSLFHRLENIEPGNWVPAAPQRLSKMAGLISHWFGPVAPDSRLRRGIDRVLVVAGLALAALGAVVWIARLFR